MVANASNHDIDYGEKGRFLSYTWKYFNYMRHLNVSEWCKM